MVLTLSVPVFPRRGGGSLLVQQREAVQVQQAAQCPTGQPGWVSRASAVSLQVVGQTQYSHAHPLPHVPSCSGDGADLVQQWSPLSSCPFKFRWRGRLSIAMLTPSAPVKSNGRSYLNSSSQSFSSFDFLKFWYFCFHTSTNIIAQAGVCTCRDIHMYFLNFSFW